MIKNYIKLAFRVLSRQKFFTFITLFGISFTLMVLMLLMSFLQAEIGQRPPMSKQDKMLMLASITLSKQHYDTLLTVDTLQVDGEMKLDSTYQPKKTGSSSSRSDFGRKVLVDYFSDMESIDHATIFDASPTYDLFVDQSKIKVKANYCDPNFWNVFDFVFLEGRPFDESEMDQELPVVVLSDRMAKKYFGRTQDIIGESIELDGKQLKIIGLISGPKMSAPFLISDAFMPYSTLPVNGGEDFYFGGFSMIMIASNGIAKTKEEIDLQTSKIPTDLDENFNTLDVTFGTLLEMYTYQLTKKKTPATSLSFMKWVFFSLVAFFVLLPTLNLINLNVSRIMDRSSEIGVRKAFGATPNNIILQFVFENIIQTIIGGIIGVVLTSGLIYLINSSKIFETTELTMDFSFFLYSLIITVLFGVLSGLIPAWKISRLQIVNALKTNQL